MATAMPSDVLSISTTRAAASPTMPIKSNTIGTPDAKRSSADGRCESLEYWRDWRKQMASRMASNSNIMPKKRRARVVVVVAIELDVSIWN